MEEKDIKYELEDLRSIADGAVPPELSQNEAENIINFIKNLINRNKELEEIKQQKLDKYLYKNQWICKDLAENYIHKSKVREKIENSYPDIAVQKLLELLEEGSDK